MIRARMRQGLEAGAQGQLSPPLALHSQLRAELELSPPDKVQVAVLCFLLLHVKPQALLCVICDVPMSPVVTSVHTHCASHRVVLSWYGFSGLLAHLVDTGPGCSR